MAARDYGIGVEISSVGLGQLLYGKDEINKSPFQRDIDAITAPEGETDVEPTPNDEEGFVDNVDPELRKELSRHVGNGVVPLSTRSPDPEVIRFSAFDY